MGLKDRNKYSARRRDTTASTYTLRQGYDKYDITLPRNDERESTNRSTSAHFSMKRFTFFGSLTNKPSFTVHTLAYGMLNRVRVCCLVERLGTLRENDCSKNEEQIRPVKTFLKNTMSCSVLRAVTDDRVKCSSRS